MLAGAGAGPDRRARNSVETGVTTATFGEFVEVWSATTDGGERGVSSAVVSAAGLVHVTTQRSLYAFSPATGAQRWVETPYTGRGARVDTEMTALGDDGDDLSLYVSVASGPLSWENGTTQVFYAGSGLMVPVPGDGTEGHGLRAFAVTPWANTCGAPGDQVFACPRWVLPLDGSSSTTPVLSADGATVYVGTDAGSFSAVDAATGAARWSAAVGSAVVAPPAVALATVFVPTAAGSLVALPADGCGAATCAPLWASPTGSGRARSCGGTCGRTGGTGTGSAASSGGGRWAATAPGACT